MKKILLPLLFFPLLVILGGCARKFGISADGTAGETARVASVGVGIGQNGELDFRVLNSGNKTVYITVFIYVQKERNVPWRWDKSPVYRLKPGESVIVDLPTIQDEIVRSEVYGAIGVFDSYEEARDAMYELTDDRKRLPLGRVSEVAGKTVYVAPQRYGFKEILDIWLAKDREGRPRELDFSVLNNTGRTVYVTCFVYSTADPVRDTWSFSRTPLLKLEDGKAGVIDVRSILEERDRKYASGILAVFDEKEKDLAEEVTYELLPPGNRIFLGRLSRIAGKTVVVNQSNYAARTQEYEYKTVGGRDGGIYFSSVKGNLKERIESAKKALKEMGEKE